MMRRGRKRVLRERHDGPPAERTIAGCNSEHTFEIGAGAGTRRSGVNSRNPAVSASGEQALALLPTARRTTYGARRRPMRTHVRPAFLLLITLIVSACGKSSSPTQPTTTEGAGGSTAIITGTVRSGSPL